MWIAYRVKKQQKLPLTTRRGIFPYIFSERAMEISFHRKLLVERPNVDPSSVKWMEKVNHLHSDKSLKVISTYGEVADIKMTDIYTGCRALRGPSPPCRQWHLLLCARIWRSDIMGGQWTLVRSNKGAKLKWCLNEKIWKWPRSKIINAWDNVQH